MTKYTTNSLNETLKLGKKLALSFSKVSTDKPSLNTNLIGLMGNLGAGKTALVKGIAQYFGIKNISSPTYVVMKVYPNKKNNSQIKNLVHIDCYRLNDYQSLLDIGLEDYINDKQSLILIEWADKIKDNLPPLTQYVKLELASNENKRIITIL